MQFCQPHWDELRAAVDERGLATLVSADGEHAMARMKSEIEGSESAASFDPLIYAHNAVFTNALRMFGISAMDGCPLCDPPAPDWVIARAADDALACAKELGLVGES